MRKQDFRSLFEMATQETLTTNIVGNFLSCPTHLYTSLSDNQSDSYGYQKTAGRCEFQRKVGKRFGFQTRSRSQIKNRIKRIKGIEKEDACDPSRSGCL
jgi:hypothetical protein